MSCIWNSVLWSWCTSRRLWKTFLVWKDCQHCTLGRNSGVFFPKIRSIKLQSQSKNYVQKTKPLSHKLPKKLVEKKKKRPKIPFLILEAPLGLYVNKKVTTPSKTIHFLAPLLLKKVRKTACTNVKTLFSGLFIKF